MITWIPKIAAISFLYAIQSYAIEQSVLYNTEDVSGQEISEIGQKFSKLSQASSQVWIIASTVAMSELTVKDCNFSDEENAHINQMTLIRMTTNNMIKSSSRYKVLWLFDNSDTKLTEEIDKRIDEENKWYEKIAQDGEQYKSISPDRVANMLSLSKGVLKKIVVLSSKN